MKASLAACFAALLSLDAGCVSPDAGDASDGEDLDDDAEPVATQELALYGRGHALPNGVPFRNESGYAATVSTAGAVDLGNEFFQDLGTNGRRCVSCHQPSTGWTVTPAGLRATFERTRGGVIDDGTGAGAIFRLVDGANSPTADVSTLDKRRKAYSMLLNKGLIRTFLPIPAAAEFELIAVDDPYRHASAAELSLFRRPLPTTNINFLATIMWDGRENLPGLSIHEDLLHQSNSAQVTHAAGRPLTAAQRASLVEFQTGLRTAQIWDDRAGNLTAAGGRGGPDELADQVFYLGINDNFGDSQTHAPFDPVVFDLYDAWTNLRSGHSFGRHNSRRNDDRRAVARGQALFNTKRIDISGVAGINDNPAFGRPANLVGTCTSCHDTPNVGNHSVSLQLNIGIADASRRTPDMPLYTLRNKATGAVTKTTDPGRALITGLWADVGKFKGPVLRALATRAPYFHNGMAQDLDAVIEFYDDRFGVGFTAQEKRDLIAFLRTL